MRKTSYVPAPFAPRSTDGSTWATAGTVAYADATYYSDTALALATRYYYRVMATDSASTASAASNIASAVTGPTFEVSEGSSGSLLSAVVVDTEASCAACEVDPIISEDVDWGDGSSTTESGDPDSMSHYFSNPGNYTVTVIANTADGPVDSSSTTADVTVAVPTPTLEFSVPEETFSAGAAAVVYPVYCSDGASAESEYLLDWGDGTPYQSYSNGTTEFDHCYANGEADYHVEAFLETSVGVVGADADLTITGSNPFDHPGTYSTGFSLSDTTTGSSLPATTGDTVQAFVTATMHDYSCSCGGGDDPESECGTVDFGNSSSGGFYFSNASGSEPCEAIDNSYHEDGQYLITMTATDGSDETKFATVDNAVPVMSTIPEQVTGSGESFSVSDSYSNMSTELSPVAFINWGDGTGPHVATVSPSGASGTITASTSSAPAPGVYTATLTLYPMGPTGTGGGPTYAVTKTFTLDVWGVVLDHGESNDLLVASSDGTENQQPLTLYFPHPAGEALTLYLSSTDASQNYLFNSGTRIVPSGSDYPAIDIASGDSASSITDEDGAIEGNSTAGCLQYTLSGEYDASDSTTTFQSDAAAGCGTVPTTAPASKPASTVSVAIMTDPDNLTNVTNATRSWLPGEVSDLWADVTGPAADIANLTYDWTIPGEALFKYSDDILAASTVSLKPQNEKFFPGIGVGLAYDHVAFFWVHTDIGNTTPEDQTVSVAVGGSPGGTFTALTTFDLAEPTSTMTVASPRGTVNTYYVETKIHQAPLNMKVGLVQATDHEVTGQGIQINASVTSPLGGQFKFVQLIEKNVYWIALANGKITRGSQNSRLVLDNADGYPYVDGAYSPNPVFPTGPDSHFMTDAPNNPLYSAGRFGANSKISTYVRRSDFFETILMFKPAGDTSKWVPISEVTWTLAFTATLSPIGLISILAGNTTIPWDVTQVAGPDPSLAYPSYLEPTWSENIAQTPIVFH